MRHAGGGIGHHKVELNDAHSPESDFVATDDEDLLAPPPQQASISENIGESVAPPQDTSEDIEDTSIDNGSHSDQSSQGSARDAGEDEDLPEDGEGGFIDAEDEEGYAEL